MHSSDRQDLGNDKYNYITAYMAKSGGTGSHITITVMTAELQKTMMMIVLMMVLAISRDVESLFFCETPTPTLGLTV